MLKDELQNRMVVELRNGEQYLLVDNYLLCKDGFMTLSTYTDTLLDSAGDKDWDIVKIFAPVSSLSMKVGKYPIWERKEDKTEITIEEIEKELGYKIKIVNNK